MKKILFATTALVATAGIAAAEVKTTGSAEIGIRGGSTIDTQFHTDVNVVFGMTGESDNGLSFGASVELSDIDGVANANATDNDAEDGGITFFVAFGGARLDMGDVDGAFDAAMIETVTVGGGSINDAQETAGYNGNAGLDGVDSQVARFSYTFNSFTGYVSVSQGQTDTNADGNVTLADATGEAVWGIGVRYTADLSNLTLGVGLGYQTQNGGDTIWGLSLDTTLSNGLKVVANYSDADIAGSHWGLGIGYSMNALSVGVNYGEYESGAKGYGLAASYDLGGGLSAQMGYGSSTSAANVDSDAWSLGLAMSF